MLKVLQYLTYQQDGYWNPVLEQWLGQSINKKKKPWLKQSSVLFLIPIISLLEPLSVSAAVSYNHDCTVHQIHRLARKCGFISEE